MAEITRRRVGELQRGVFKILLDYPDGLPAKDVLQRLEQVVPPSDFEKSNYPRRPNIRRFEKMARFSTIALVKAGWLVKSKGCWYVTEEGKRAYHQIQDPEKFAREASRLVGHLVVARCCAHLKRVLSLNRIRRGCHERPGCAPGGGSENIQAYYR